MPTNYCQVADVQKWLQGIDQSPLLQQGTDIPSLIASIMPAAKQEMVRFMGQDLVQQDRTVRIDGSGLAYIMFPYFPILTVKSAKIFWGYNQLFYQFVNIRHTTSQPEIYNIPNEDIGDADLIVERDTGRLMINPFSISLQSASITPLWNLTWSVQKDNVLIEAITGFDGVANPFPQEIIDAQAKLVAMEIGEMCAGFMTAGGTSLKFGGESRTWGAVKYAGLFDAWASQIENAMETWRAGAYRL